MDPNTINHQPEFDLPEPAPKNNEKAEQEVEKPSDRASSKETGDRMEMPAAPAPMPLVDPGQLAVPTASSPASTDGGSSNTSGTGHLIADDVDLIEKEWVSKAKAIVQQTKDDPHRQNKELNKIKADYIQKRYNKEIKLDE